jgi:uncharacterized protein YgiM (DUF1202 family)
MIPAALCLILLVWQSSVMACGSIKMWLAEYERGGRHKALFHIMDCADSYKAPEDDFIMLPIIKDALGRGSEISQLASRVFKTYNHLWGAREEPEYAEVLKAINGISDFKKFGLYGSWYYVTAQNGVNMRDKPSLGGEIITSVKYGMQVRVGERVGEWLQVAPVGPGSVDPRYERKQGWIHASFLHPY